MSDAGKGVFLSYASQDAEAARKICDALRAAGVEVWFDQSELVGGDAWDQKIRRQIKECALLIPIISASTQARTEGYFRLEWRLADQRTHLMAKGRAFLLPVVIDDSPEAEAAVPDSFLDVQWTRLRPVDYAGPGPQKDEDPALGKLVVRVKDLLRADPSARTKVPRFKGQWSKHPMPEAASPASRARRWLAPVLGGIVIAAIVLAIAQPWRKAGARTPGPGSSSVPAPTTEAQQLVAQAWTLLNKSGMARAELESAAALCRRATELEPANADAWAAWSSVNTWLVFHGFDRSPARFEAARDYAAKALSLAPRSYEARLAQALFWTRGVWTMSGQTRAEVRGVLSELLRERPDEPRALFSLGVLLIQDSATAAESIAVLERMARNPDFAAVAWDEIGWFQFFWGNFAEAEIAAKKSAAIMSYWNNLGLRITLAMRVQGDLERGRILIDQMPASILQEDWGIGFACDLYQWRREPQKAIEALERSSRDWVHDFFFDGPRGYLLGRVRQQAGQEHAARRDYERALVLLEQRLEETPNDANLLALKAATLRRLGRQEEAEKVYALLKEMQREDPILRLEFESAPVAVESIRQMMQQPYGGTGRVMFTPASLRLSPDFDPVRNTPEFQALLATLPPPGRE